MTFVLNSPHEYRGFIINEFTKLERALDKHLLFEFFDKDNSAMHWKMHEILLDRLTFDGKRTAVKGILDSRATSDGFVKTKNNSYPNGKLFDEVRQLIEVRNQFAHYLLVTDHANPESVITLLKFRDNTKLLIYKQVDFDDLVVRTMKSTSDIFKLIPDGAV